MSHQWNASFKRQQLEHNSPAGEDLCIAQVFFFEGEPPITSYNDKKGKHQGQRGVTLPKI